MREYQPYIIPIDYIPFFPALNVGLAAARSWVAVPLGYLNFLGGGICLADGAERLPAC